MLLVFLSLFILVNRYLNVVLVYISLMNIDIYFDMFVEHSNTLFVVYSLEYFLVFFFVNFEGSLGSLDIRVLLDKCVVV